MFADKPYQGQDPQKAGVIIIGIDANYPPDLEQKREQLELVKEYHCDGVAFWRDHNKHHPFLLPAFKGQRGGITYHQDFARLALSAKYAACISFVELLNVPTLGRTEEEGFWEIFKQEHAEKHLEELDDILHKSKNRELILLSDGVIQKMLEIKDKYGIFSWMPSLNNINKVKEKEVDRFKKGLGDTSKWSGIFELNTESTLHHEVIRAYHFSSTHSKKEAFLKELKNMIDSHCFCW